MFTDQGNEGASNKILQYLQEYGAWLRTLDFMRQENNHLKDRIGVIAQSRINGELLSELEKFQNKFIEKDAVISMFRNDIIAMESQLKNVIPENVQVGSDLIKRQDKRRAEMQLMEKEFNLLKHNFNQYLARY